MLIGLVLMAVGGFIAVVGGQVFADGWQAWRSGPAAQAGPSGQPTSPAAGARTVAEKEAAKRHAFLDLRRPLQESVIGADGDLAVHEFNASGIGQISIPLDGASYTIPISKNDGLRVWVYNTDDSIKKLARVGPAENHELIDVTQLRAADRETSLLIGETAVVETSDGKIIQLLLVDAHVRANGDDIDDARFKYEAYPPGISQIRALR